MKSGDLVLFKKHTSEQEMFLYFDSETLYHYWGFEWINWVGKRIKMSRSLSKYYWAPEKVICPKEEEVPTTQPLAVYNGSSWDKMKSILDTRDLGTPSLTTRSLWDSPNMKEEHPF